MCQPSVERTSGFTLVELVVVIVILGIVAAFAAPRFFDNQTFSQRGYYEELAAALKYSQKLAVASGCRVRVVSNANGYRVWQQAELGDTCNADDTTWATPVTLADGEVLAGSTPQGVDVSPDVTLVFDPLGKIESGADQDITVAPFVLTVHAASGFIEAP